MNNQNIKDRLLKIFKSEFDINKKADLNNFATETFEYNLGFEYEDSNKKWHEVVLDVYIQVNKIKSKTDDITIESCVLIKLDFFIDGEVKLTNKDLETKINSIITSTKKCTKCKEILKKKTMSTTISQNSQEMMERIVRKEFDSYPQPWQELSAQKVIKTARSYKMREEFIQGMLNDLMT